MKKFLLFSVASLFLVFAALAQERTVSGKVTSVEDGSALPGVNVVLKGTTTGTVTDVSGNFSLAIPSEGGTLVFSFIGLASEEIPVGSRSVIDVQMSSDVRQLSEVVVTAVGIERSKKALGYSVENVTGEKVQQVSEPDPLRGLQGKVPGVNIQGSSGASGSATRITIRGNSSFLGNNQPLFVVNGIPFANDVNVRAENTNLTQGGAYGSRIADLDPNDIESMTVLKGAAAAALYGTRAANGVVLITTKSGRSSASRKGLEVTYSFSYALEEISNVPDYQNKYGTGTAFNYSQVNGSWGAPFGQGLDSIPHWFNNNPALEAAFPEQFGTIVPYVAQPDNVKDFFDTGNIMEHSLSFSGGNEKANISATVSRMEQDGFVPNTEFNRTNLSLGGNTILDNGLNVGGHFSYATTFQRGTLGGANNSINGSSAFARTLFLGRNWDLQGQPFINPLDNSPVFFVATGQATNPIWSTQNEGFESNVDRYTAAINLGYDIFDWLNVSYKIGINTYSQRNLEFSRPGSRAQGGIGQIIDDKINYQEIESNFLITVTRNINEDLSFRGVVGHNINQRTTDRQSFLATNYVVFDIDDLDNTSTVAPNGGDFQKRRIVGVFGDFTFGYKDWAFLTLTGRNDLSSTLPSSNRSFFYPAISTSFIFTDALNINSNILSNGKLRASWSQVGNDTDPYLLQNIFFVNAASQGLTSGFSSNTNAFPFTPTGGSTTPGGTLSNSERDPNLKPERTTEVELGASLGFFNNRATVDVTVYDRRTRDQIARQSIPDASGFDVFFTNFGEMSNRGIEIGLDVTPITLSNGFNWNLYGTFTHNKNKVESLTDGVEELVITNLFAGSVAPVLRPGEEYGLIRGSVTARDDEGNLLIDPASGLPINALDPAIVGNPNPDFLVGLTNTFSYKGITFSAVFDWRQGGDIYSVTTFSLLGRGVLESTGENREQNWIIPGVQGDVTTQEPIRDENGQKIPNRTLVETNDLWFSTGGGVGSFGINAQDEWNVWDATVFRLREVALSYDLPRSLLENTPIGSVRVSLTGRNLWFKAPNFPEGSNFDPEISNFGAQNIQGFEYTNAPSVRRYGFNLRVTF